LATIFNEIVAHLGTFRIRQTELSIVGKVHSEFTTEISHKLSKLKSHQLQFGS